LSRRGVPVFNAPGANANAVKELVLAGLLIAARNVCQAWAFARALTGDDRELEAAVEAGKKASSASSCRAGRWASWAWAPSASKPPTPRSASA
jgi:lactate dehydrogenase-like 2-hydroxyacid dehydrogenase